jgi:hypothetical protein
LSKYLVLAGCVPQGAPNAEYIEVIEPWISLPVLKLII